MSYDRTLIVIRERSFLELLDLGLLVVRDRPLVLGVTAVIGIAPFAALNVWLLSDPAFSRTLWLFLLLMEIPWATAPLTIVLGDLMFGVPTQPSRISRVFVSRYLAFFVTQFLLRGLLFAVVIGFVLVPSRFVFLSEVVLLERVGIVRAFRRSAAICRGYEGELLMRSVGLVILGLTFAICFQRGVDSVASVMVGGELTWDEPGLADLRGLLFQLGIWIAVAYFAVVRFLCYIDRRIRLEGWEIELRLRSVGRSLEEKSQ
jgi:hypothetical protein